MFRSYNKDFFKKWSLEMAYVLGYIFADGTIFKNRRGAHFLEIISTDLEIIKKIKKILGSEHKIGIKLRENRKWKTAYRIQIGSKEMIGDLMNRGLIQSKSLVSVFPAVPKLYLGSFVRGYFDGDGGVYFGKCWKRDRGKYTWVFQTGFTSGSKKFLLGLQQSLNGYLKGGYLYTKQRGGYGLNFSRHDSVALFKLMYNNVSTGAFLERKFNTFLKAFRVLKYNVAGVV